MTHLLICAAVLLGQVPPDPLDTSPPASPTAPSETAEQPRAEPPATPAEPANTTSPDADESESGENAESEEAESELEKILGSGALGLMLDGGLFMWPILLMGIVAAGVIIERYRSLKMLSGDSSGLREEVRQLLQQDRVEEALTRCDGERGPVPAILSAGLRKYLVLQRLGYDAGRIEEQVVKSMDDYGVHVVAALEKHLPILATISSAAPMLGFLGTVQGMIVAFQDIVAKMGEMNIVEAAADGISVALLTTCFGLIVGIPAFVAFNYFTGVINRFVLEVEESATELIEAVTLQLALAGKSAGGEDSQSAERPVPATVET